MRAENRDTFDYIKLDELIRYMLSKENRKVLIVVPIVLALVTLLITYLLPNTYVSKTKFSLVKSDIQQLNNPTIVKEMLISEDTLQPLMAKYSLDFANIEEFQKAVTLKSDTIMELSVKYKDPSIAHQITESLLSVYLEKANSSFKEKQTLIQQLLVTYQTQYDQTLANINRNKETLKQIESNTAINSVEREMMRVRILDYLVKDENMVRALATTIKDVQLQLQSLEDAYIIDKPSVPERALSKHIGLNTVVSYFLTLILLLAYLFIKRYFLKYIAK
ncbi:hypothetical protein [Brevibacillus sp. SYSU BS000544]|uniref:hypothetical protein n=1 Tax=Brevibacillus sp. SYSU BS000544 TaxID=3416443 RepID=UPI003CE50BFF